MLMNEQGEGVRHDRGAHCWPPGDPRIARALYQAACDAATDKRSGYDDPADALASWCRSRSIRRLVVGERGVTDLAVVRVLAIVLAALAACWWVAAPIMAIGHHDVPRCAVVAASADQGGDSAGLIGADYQAAPLLVVGQGGPRASAGGRWVRGGRVIGYSATEDSTVYAHEGCR